MSTPPDIEALASAWVRIVEEATLPSDYEGTARLKSRLATLCIVFLKKN